MTLGLKWNVNSILLCDCCVFDPAQKVAVQKGNRFWGGFLPLKIVGMNIIPASKPLILPLFTILCHHAHKQLMGGKKTHACALKAYTQRRALLTWGQRSGEL